MSIFNIPNTTEEQIKELIEEISQIENLYLDKKQILIRLRKIIKNK